MSEDVHIVDPPRPMRSAAMPAEPEKRERVTLRLVGGPFHGTEFSTWTKAKRLEIPWTPDTTPPETPDEDATRSEKRPKPVEPFSMIAVYVRASEDADTATFFEYEV